jgi:putative PIN family toxin of toxin-antitoxin system
VTVLRAVADPGVFVSALIGREPKAAPALLVDALLEGRWRPVVSPLLRAELEGVLLRPKFRRYASEDEARLFVARLVQRAEFGADPASPPRWTADPKDDYLIALAAAAGADAVISGDRHLTALTRSPVLVLTPRAFLDRLDEGP